MTVSHVGLTVTDLPAATAFFLAALGPLGYKYIGTKGDLIGLGVTQADFFLSLSIDSVKFAPTHLAFRANHKRNVKDFYVNALEAGATGAGNPSYRGDQNEIYNAAVVDLDGNTIEVVYYRQQRPDTKERTGRHASNATPAGAEKTSSTTLPRKKVPTPQRSGTVPLNQTTSARSLGARRSKSGFLDTIVDIATGAAVACLATWKSQNQQDHHYRYGGRGGGMGGGSRPASRADWTSSLLDLWPSTNKRRSNSSMRGSGGKNFADRAMNGGGYNNRSRTSMNGYRDDDRPYRSSRPKSAYDLREDERRRDFGDRPPPRARPKSSYFGGG